MLGKATMLGPNHQWELVSIPIFTVTEFLRGADIIGFLLTLMIVFQDVMQLILHECRTTVIVIPLPVILDHMHRYELSQSQVCWQIPIVPVPLVSSCPAPTSVNLL
jgi:hypothetical protein